MIHRKLKQIERTVLNTDLDGASEGIFDGMVDIDGTAAYFKRKIRRVVEG